MSEPKIIVKDKLEILELHPLEIWLIKRWREKYRFGEITIIVQDGIPQRIKQVIFNDDPRDK